MDESNLIDLCPLLGSFSGCLGNVFRLSFLGNQTNSFFLVGQVSVVLSASGIERCALHTR